MKYDHLERFPITLRTLAPVFIGSGERLNKKEYIFDQKKGTIHFLDFPKFIEFLKQRSLLSKYENFLIKPGASDFKAFLTDNHIPETDYQFFVSYSIAAGEAVQASNFREVLTFIKDPTGLPYIPGSSVKGAVRTALAAMLLKKGDWARDRQNIEKADSAGNIRNYLKRERNTLEDKIFYRLDIKNPANAANSPGPINDFMQGIRISDSAPLSADNLVLTGKYDRKPDGTYNLLPIFRECLMPGSEARLTVTLDMPVLSKVGLDAKKIEDALHEFADQHYASYEQHFAELADDAPIAAREGVDLILGGGAGYASKTLVYNLYTNREQALAMAARIMMAQFPRHGHNKDVKIYQVAPHTLKTTMYKGQFYQMGRCAISMQ